MSNQNSASHWCKSVIDQVVPSTAIPLVSPAPSFNSNPASIQSKSPATVSSQPAAQQLNPQYIHLYNQLYGIPQTVDSTRTYASVVAQPPAYTANVGMSRPISAPWGPTYAAVAAPVIPPPPVPVPSPASIAAALQQKKPNKSRFTALPAPGLSGPPGLTAERTAPVTTSAQPSASAPAAQPESLKKFVTRAFGSCSSNEEREFMTKALKDLIAKVSADGRLHVHKWEIEPVPVFVPPSAAPAISSFAAPIVSKTTGLSSQSASYNPYLSAEANSAAGGDKNDKKRKSRFVETNDDDTSYGINYSESGSNKKPVLAGIDKLNTPQEIKMREQRANRFKTDEPSSTMTFTTTNMVDTNRKKNKKNNANAAKIAALMSHNASSADLAADFDMDSLKIVGTCQKLEKDYLRLTSAPHPSVVRPEAVLRKAITLIKNKWAKEEVDYIYMCSQLKSIRQDLTVQHIQNDFTVHVYETHARVALESDDMNEYNQCQTQLKQLYAAGLQGNEMEFIAYRVLYYVYLLGNKKYTAGNMDLANLMASLTPEARRNEAVAHALRIRQALQLDNYHAFFRLYKSTPNMGMYILDLMLDNWRALSLQKMCRAYKPDVEVAFVVDELAFAEVEEGVEFMRKVGCILVKDKERGQLVWNTKDTVVDIAALQTQAKLLL